MNQKKFNPAIRITLAIVIYFTVMFVVLGICLAAGIVDRLRTDYALLAVMNIVAGVVIGGAVMLVYRLLDRGNPLQFGFQIRKKDIGFAVVIIVISALIAWGFALMMGQDEQVTAEFHYDKLVSLSFIWLLVLGCVGWIVGVLQEELLNRSYFFANLNRMSVIVMFVVSNVLFSLTHVPTNGFHPVQLLIHFVGGLAYGYVYFKSGSIWLAAIVHGVHNFLLDILFNNDYSVSLVTFGRQLTDGEKLIQQVLLVAVILLITHLFYGKNGIWTPASNLSKLWNRNDSIRQVKDNSIINPL